MTNIIRRAFPYIYLLTINIKIITIKNRIFLFFLYYLFSLPFAINSNSPFLCTISSVRYVVPEGHHLLQMAVS